MASEKNGARKVGRLVQQIVECLQRPESDARPLAQHVADLRAAGCPGADGAGGSWEEFCRARLGCEATELQEILDGAAALQELGLVNPSIAQAREALRFEVDDEATADATPAEIPEEALTPLQRLQRDWLELTEEERERFLAWANAGQVKPKRRRGRPRKNP